MKKQNSNDNDSSKKDRSRKNSSDTESKGARIDLGFSKLVSTLDSERKQGQADITSLGKSIANGSSFKVIDSEQQKLTAPINDYKLLVQNKRWDELRRLTESRMSSKGDDGDHEATIWWVRSQVESGGVPVSILAAPLDVASRNITKYRDLKSSSIIRPELTDPIFQKEVAKLLFEVARKLLPTLTDKHALTFIERAILLDPSLKASASDLLVKEKSRISKQPGRKVLREKRIYDIDTLMDVIAKMSLQHVSKETSPKLNVKNEGVRSDIQESPPPTKSFVKPFVIVSLIILATVYFWDRLEIFHSPPIEISSPPLTSGNGTVGHEIPSSKRVTNITGIDTILYEIGEKNVKTGDSVIENPSIEDKLEGQSIGTANTNSPQELAVDPDISKVIPERVLEDKPVLPNLTSITRKEKIDTTGPIEGTVFYPDLQRGDRRADRDDRGLFPESRSERSNEKRETFKQGKLYRVIAKTRVLSSPSYFAVTMAFLDQGARVEVVEKTGEWLKLRSKMGQSGYILAQDTEPLN